MSQEIEIDNRFKEHLAQYSNFWKNKNRIEKFKELGIDYLLDDSEAYMKALGDNGLIEKFWGLCEKYFGYQSENPNIDNLGACMFLTYASAALKDTLPAVLKDYLQMIQEHGAEAVQANLNKWLTETSELGCGDDITVVMVYFAKE